MHNFSEQTFTEIHADVSHFNEDTKQSSVTCQNPETTKYLASYQQH